MASFWDDISETLISAFGFDDREEDYLPPARSGKRKAREELRRPARSSKVRQYPTPRSSSRLKDARLPDIGNKEPQYLAREHRGSSDVDLPAAESSERGSYGPTFGHRDSLDHTPPKSHLRRSSGSTPADSSVGQGHHSRRDLAYAGSPASQSRRQSTAARRASSDRVRGQRTSFFVTLASAMNTLVSTITGGEPIDEGEPETTEADIQAQEHAKWLDESDADLSEGALGRKYFGPALWAKRQRRVRNVARLESRFEDRTRMQPDPEFAETQQLESISEGGTAMLEPQSELSTESFNEPESESEPRTSSTIKPISSKKAVTPSIPPIKPVSPKKAVTQSASTIKPVSPKKPKPASLAEPRLRPISIAKPVALKNSMPATPIKRFSKPDPRKFFEEWSTEPKKRTHKAISEFPESFQTRIRDELQEPVYTLRDVEIRDMIWQIRDLMEQLVSDFFDGHPDLSKNKAKSLIRTFEEKKPATFFIIKNIAGGGPQGEDGWTELLCDQQKRRALVCGIIGNALVEQVFKHPFFGGDEETIDKILDAQKELRDEDAFARKHRSALILKPVLCGPNYSETVNDDPVDEDGTTYNHISTLGRNMEFTHRKYEVPKDPVVQGSLYIPPNFVVHVKVVVSALQDHLQLLLSVLRGKRPRKEPGVDAIAAFDEALTKIVTTAGLLALQMAADPFTVYYHVPLAKDELFDQKKHEAINEHAMEQTHPRHPDTVFASEAERKVAQDYEALNEILLMDGLTAYRKGGWETPNSQPLWDGKRYEGREYAGEGYAEMGYRARVLTHGWVYCRWERPGRVAERVKGKGAAK